ncbi:CDP-alcohol phosphatidyltransferase family protein [Microbacterium sp. GXF6406]
MSRIPLQDARQALASARKPATDVPAYLRWVNRPLGGRVAVLAAHWGWAPNGVTALSALFGAAGIVVLAASTAWWSGPAAALLLLIGYILDSADGQLARIQKRGGPAGEWLDHVVDGARAPLVHIAVAVHLLRADRPLALVLLAALFSVLVSAWFLSQLLAEKLLPASAASSPERSSSILNALIRQPQDSSTTYLLLCAIGAPMIFVLLYSALFAWHVVICAASLRRKYRQLTEV